MKAISVASTETAAYGLPILRLYADSAIGRDCMPLFIPDILGKWTGHVCLAWHMQRLGKNIPRRFAMRYADALSLVLVLHPLEGSGEFLSSGAFSILDNMVTTGKWIEIPAGDAQLNVNIAGHIRTFDIDSLDVPRHISQVSSLATIKSGDIIILDDTAVTVPLVPNTYITGNINGTDCLNIKVK